MKIGEVVQKAAIDNGISGVMALSEHCGLSYERTARVWRGETSAKVADVIQVLDSVGLVLKIVKSKG